MEQKAINSAKAALSRASKAVRALEASRNLSEQREAWWDFLLASSAIYEKLKRGLKRQDPSSVKFIDDMQKERLQDELLTYLLYARNAEYHGIEAVVEPVPGAIQIGPVGITTSVDEDRDFSEEDRPLREYNNTFFLDGEEVNPDDYPEFFQRLRSRLALRPVVGGRDNRTFNPPEQRLGKPLRLEIVNVAKIALASHADLVARAEALASPG